MSDGPPAGWLATYDQQMAQFRDIVMRRGALLPGEADDRRVRTSYAQLCEAVHHHELVHWAVDCMMLLSEQDVLLNTYREQP